MFGQGRDRLVVPLGAGAAPTDPEVKPNDPPPPPAETPKGAAAHPFVQGLLATLPEPGTHWGDDDREQLGPAPPRAASGRSTRLPRKVERL